MTGDTVVARTELHGFKEHAAINCPRSVTGAGNVGNPVWSACDDIAVICAGSGYPQQSTLISVRMRTVDRYYRPIGGDLWKMSRSLKVPE